ncbi:hypothetical protein Taro_033794 [Colocasia esculenta]|uniref:Uncharacterized protein n=1 Tax=Colocasia esculenta TaxID=4460 RepID=A0A843VYX0_COLES|nr:hypothetical protein [Colocasia esculenta]
MCGSGKPHPTHSLLPSKISKNRQRKSSPFVPSSSFPMNNTRNLLSLPSVVVRRLFRNASLVGYPRFSVSQARVLVVLGVLSRVPRGARHGPVACGCKYGVGWSPQLFDFFLVERQLDLSSVTARLRVTVAREFVTHSRARYGVPCYGTGSFVVSVLVPCGNRCDLPLNVLYLSRVVVLTCVVFWLTALGGYLLTSATCVGLVSSELDINGGLASRGVTLTPCSFPHSLPSSSPTFTLEPLHKFRWSTGVRGAAVVSVVATNQAGNDELERGVRGEFLGFRHDSWFYGSSIAFLSVVVRRLFRNASLVGYPRFSVSQARVLVVLGLLSRYGVSWSPQLFDFFLVERQLDLSSVTAGLRVIVAREFVTHSRARYGVPCYGSGSLVVSVLVPCGNRDLYPVWVMSHLASASSAASPSSPAIVGILSSVAAADISSSTIMSSSTISLSVGDDVSTSSPLVISSTSSSTDAPSPHWCLEATIFVIEEARRDLRES